MRAYGATGAVYAAVVALVTAAVLVVVGRPAAAASAMGRAAAADAFCARGRLSGVGAHDANGAGPTAGRACQPIGAARIPAAGAPAPMAEAAGAYD